VENEQMGVLRLADFEFSEQVQIEWTDPHMFEKMKSGVGFANPQVEHSVKVNV
jgi:6-pyruvoyltetrahydropterin/6-carboxytetrahydropterin synthase